MEFCGCAQNDNGVIWVAAALPAVATPRKSFVTQKVVGILGKSRFRYHRTEQKLPLNRMLLSSTVVIAHTESDTHQKLADRFTRQTMDYGPG